MDYGDAVCVGCKRSVVGIRTGAGGVPIHRGHANPEWDRVCMSTGIEAPGARRRSESDPELIALREQLTKAGIEIATLNATVAGYVKLTTDLSIEKSTLEGKVREMTIAHARETGELRAQLSAASSIEHTEIES